MIYYLFTNINTILLSWFSPVFTIIIWSFLVSILVTLIYYLFSFQKNILINKNSLKQMREKMLSDSSNVLSSDITLLLKVSFKQFFMVLGPTLISTIPLLFLWGMLAYEFDRIPPKTGDRTDVIISPVVNNLFINGEKHTANHNESFTIKWHKDKTVIIKMLKDSKEIVISKEKPQYYLNKKKWWNLLLPSPYGYLDQSIQINSIYFDLPTKEYLPWGPQWVKSWWFIFVFSMFVFSLVLKVVFRIE